MATYNLQGAITEIIVQIATVSGIVAAPTEPAEQVTSWPAAFAYATEGESINEPPDTIKDLHNIQIAVMMPRNDMRQCIRTMLPLYEPMIDALVTYRNGRTSSHWSTFGGSIIYTLGPIEWGDSDMFGYLITLTRVKIQNTT